MAKKVKTAKRTRRSSTKAAPIPDSGIEVPVEKLRWHCAPHDLGIQSIDQVQPSTEIIGQDRALRALRVGLEMSQHGYNIFVTGSTGTGRTTTIKRLLHEYEQQKAELTDKCYVHNFHDSDSPLMITLPAGQGAAFRKDMEAFVGELLKGIPALFESRRYQEQRKSLLEHFQSRQRSVLKDFEKRVKDKGFEVVQIQSGPSMRPEIAPVIDGNPASVEQLQAKVDAGEMQQSELNNILAIQAGMEGQMDLVMREMRNIERRAKKSLEELTHKIVVPFAEELLDDLKSKYTTQRAMQYLNDVKQDVLENVQRFNPREEQQQTSLLGVTMHRDEDTFLEYQVNVVVDNSEEKGPPVIIETNPRYKNLFGTIERMIDRNGVWRTDFTHIKAGSLVKADGGFLVINAVDALTEPGVWTTLKRVLRNRQIEIQPLETSIFGSSSALKPEPIDLNVKVVMIGDAYVYHVLYEMDDDFKKIFKIRADFDNQMPNDQKSMASYVSFIKRLCDEEKLRPFELSGILEFIEYGVRLAGDQKKLSTRFSMLADIIREADYWTGKNGAMHITDTNVRKAIDERIERVKMVEERIQEMIINGSIMIDTDGSAVGQVNGLSVLDVHDYAFGKPSRITVKTAMGRGGIINIEREADMSGPSHNKGVLILGGYLRYKYAQDKPLVMSASIAFEQSYSGVDGDSASSTEVYAILSSLSKVPIRQDLAVTGSVNQHGEVQVIGGVNLKIEGFFDVCKARGLTGTQGVLIPHGNISDLMLRHDIVDSVREKKFHIYGVRTIDAGIALLTGRPAEEIHKLVNAQLTKFMKRHKKLGG
jgi:lon-related putative ATP-dependent protease